MNAYAYANANPLSFTDATGLCANEKKDCLQVAMNTYSMDTTLDSIVGFGVGTAAFGGSMQAINKTAVKPRGGIAGGGPSGHYTSYSRRYLGDVGRTIGRLGVGTVKRVGGILGAGVGAMSEHAEGIDAYLECLAENNT